MFQKENPGTLAGASGADRSIRERNITPPDSHTQAGKSGAVQKCRTPSRVTCRARIGETRKAVANSDAAFSRWQAAGFLIANAMSLHRAGPYRGPGRQAIEGTWPEATVADALGGKHAATSLNQFLDQQTSLHGRAWRQSADDDFLAGLHAGEAWTRKHKRFVSADEAAKRLWIGLEERDDLDLRTIGAADCSKAKRAEYARDRRRERDRQRIEAKRRANGSVPREVYLAGSAALEAKARGVSTKTIYRERKRAITANVQCVSPHHIEASLLLNIRKGDGLGTFTGKGQSRPVQTCSPVLHAEPATSGVKPAPSGPSSARKKKNRRQQHPPQTGESRRWGDGMRLAYPRPLFPA